MTYPKIRPCRYSTQGRCPTHRTAQAIFCCPALPKDSVHQISSSFSPFLIFPSRILSPNLIQMCCLSPTRLPFHCSLWNWVSLAKKATCVHGLFLSHFFQLLVLTHKRHYGVSQLTYSLARSAISVVSDDLWQS